MIGSNPGGDTRQIFGRNKAADQREQDCGEA